LESFKVFKVELKSPTGSFFLYGEWVFSFD
jgi:hypothetical protein